MNVISPAKISKFSDSYVLYYNDRNCLAPFNLADPVRRLAVWLSGSALASINVVALRQTRLVLGWVTVCGRVNHFDM